MKEASYLDNHLIRFSPPLARIHNIEPSSKQKNGWRMLRFTSVTESVTWIQIHIALDLRTDEKMKGKKKNIRARQIPNPSPIWNKPTTPSHYAHASPQEHQYSSRIGFRIAISPMRGCKWDKVRVRTEGESCGAGCDGWQWNVFQVRKTHTKKSWKSVIEPCVIETENPRERWPWYAQL